MCLKVSLYLYHWWYSRDLDHLKINYFCRRLTLHNITPYVPGGVGRGILRHLMALFNVTPTFNFSLFTIYVMSPVLRDEPIAINRV